MALSALLLLAAASAAAADPGPAQVLYPPPGAILTSNPVLVMILGPDSPELPAFRLDGEPLAVEKLSFAEAWSRVPARIGVPVGPDDLPLRSALLADKTGKVVWTAVEALPEGEHTVTLDGVTLSTFSSRLPREADVRSWDEPVLRVHASPASPDEARDCGQCHGAGAPGDPPVLGVTSVPEVCHSCHTEVDLSLAHEHVMEFLAKCQMCHDPHAATRPNLLIDTRERVCTLCHEYGHAR